MAMPQHSRRQQPSTSSHQPAETMQTQSSMRVMVLSVYLPTNEQLETYLVNAGRYATTSTTPVLLGFLSASVPADKWQSIILRAIDDAAAVSAAASSGEVATILRPVKPNDDNYSMFVGRKWRPPISDGGKKWLPSAVRGNTGKSVDDEDNTTVFPRYDCCAQCTKCPRTTTSETTSSHDRPTFLHKCSRCKFVRYCDRTCQMKHWKRIHKASCEPARHVSLNEALLGHEGYFISPEECKSIHKALTSTDITTAATGDDGAALIQCFAAYFESVSSLGGCFVL